MTAAIGSGGYALEFHLPAHKDDIVSAAWSPDGQTIATASYDGTIAIWSLTKRSLLHRMALVDGPAWRMSPLAVSVAWAPSARNLLSSGDAGIQLWDPWTATIVKKFGTKGDPSDAIAWSPDGRRFAFATGSNNNSVRVWDVRANRVIRTFETSSLPRTIVWLGRSMRIAIGLADGNIELLDVQLGTRAHTFRGHNNFVSSMVALPDGERLLSASHDATIRIWHIAGKAPPRTLEGHTARVVCGAISPDGRLAASHSEDREVRLWRTDTWETVALIHAGRVRSPNTSSLVFHPSEPLLAVPDGGGLGIWRFDRAALYRPSRNAVHYRNAKVVLVGDSGVGKSGLGLVLTGQRFEATDSTHGRRVWSMESSREPNELGSSEIRETLLWDLAGQPGYRVFHRQHLDEVAIGMVLFDSRSETDPFAGVAYWGRALDEATRGFPIVKFLVASRVDRGGASVSQERIELMKERYGFEGYFETSAKSGIGVHELAAALRSAILWERLPLVTAPELFANK